jgi:hypothetical protein
MRIVARSTLNTAAPGTDRAAATFPTFTHLADGSLLATYSIGSTKDSDDVTVEVRRSIDGGATWSDPERPFETILLGRRGSLKFAPVTRLGGDRLIVTCLWIDREAFPGKPLFNPETEGCLPMAILVADSANAGRTWTPWRLVPMPPDVGPPSLTTGILRFPSGRLVLSVETNKSYLDASPWRQRVVHLSSDDGGATWSAPATVVADPSGQLANWDQRGAVGPDGRLVSFAWVYDFAAVAYRTIRRRISTDDGRSFGPPTDLGFADQPGHPAILPDGRVVLAWVDRFGTRSIRARIASSIDAPFDPTSEIVLFDAADRSAGAAGMAVTASPSGTTGDALVEMQTWSYGLCHADTLPNGDVGVVHYAPGESGGIEVRWLRLTIDG